MEDNGALIKDLFKKYMTPSVLALLCSTISTIVNGIVAGQFLGSSALAAISICVPFFYLFTTLGALIGMGSASAAAKFISKDDYKNVNKLYSASVFLIFGIGIIVSAICFAFRNPVAEALTKDLSLLALVKDYLTCFLPLGVFTMFIYVPMNFARLDGKPQVGVYMFLSMTVFNIVTDLILLRFTDLGISGIALGTAAGSIGAVLTGTFFLHKGKSKIKLGSPKGVSLKQIIVLGSPMALNNGLTLFKTLIINGILLSIGTTFSVAIFGIISTINTVAVAILSGIGQASVPLLGVFYEERDTTSLSQTTSLALKIAVAAMFIFDLLLLIFYKNICLLFNITSPEMLAGFRPALFYFGISILVAAVNITLTFHYSATSRIKLANITAIFRGFIFAAAFAYAFSYSFGVTGVWISLAAAEAASLLIVFIYVYYAVTKNKLLSFPLLINKSYQDEGKYISFSVDDKEIKAAQAAEKISEFCENIDLPMKKTMLISMSVEEILTLIIGKNSEQGKSISVSVRIFFLDGMIVVRFRNTGIKFDPINYYRETISDDIEKNLDLLGIKYIAESANVIEYRETFGINNLVILT